MRFSSYYRKQYGLTALETLLAVVACGFWIGASRWFMWWGGGSYGPRLLCETVPALVILLIPVVANLSVREGGRRSALTVCFLLAGILSVGIHWRGATAAVALEWNATPVGVDIAPHRVWDWKDPQFLRGLRDPVGVGQLVNARVRGKPLGFYAVLPCRLLDTRSTAGVFGGPSLIGLQIRHIPVPDGPCGIPHGAGAYSLNVLALPKGPLAWLNVWAAGEPMPSTSVLNAPTGAPTANSAIVRAGKDGGISVYATQGTDLVIDITGYFANAEGTEF